MKQNNSKYFIQTLAIMALSVVAFVLVKPFLPTKLFPEPKTALKNIVVDSLMLEALAEAEEKVVNNSKIDTIKKTSVSLNQNKINDTFNESDYVGYQYLVPFFEKLQNLEKTGKGNVRIAYYGDSMNDGDMIVQDFRANFQDRFGGNGVGFVNIVSESSASRGTVKHQHSKKWKTISFVNTKSNGVPFGISGNVFFANDTAASHWVNFEASFFKHLKTLAKPTLYYGKSKNNNGELIIINDKDTIFKTLNPSNTLNVLPLAESGKKVKLLFKNTDSIPFYGVSFESEPGVYVDNFSNRGNSGLPLTSLKPEVLSAFNSKLNYDLIILQYGTNVLGNGSKNFSWYQNRMKNVIAHLRTAMPNVPIVVVSIADKATKYEARMQTDSAVIPLVYTQKKYASETQSGFINLFELMGGAGTMVKWVENEPAKANKDYTHFNYRGSKLVADLLYQQLIKGYTKFLNKQEPIKQVTTDSLNTSANSK